jgi:hypothetical protein
MLIGMIVINVYVFAMRKLPLYKMKRRLFFRVIYEDFHQEDRFSLLFYTIFFMKRFVYALVLVFVSETKLVGLDIFIFLLTIGPMLYYSYALPYKFIGLNALLCIDEFSEFMCGIIMLHYQSAWISDSEFFGYA